VTIGGLVPALPSSVLETLWVQVAALLPDRQVHHPLGCHRPRIPDRLVFDKLVQVLVFGCGYRRIADATCSATTLRRRRDEWISAGVAEQLRLLVLAALRPAVRLGAGARGGGRLHHQGPLWRPGRRAQPGGSPQAGAETLGGGRGGWPAVGGAAAPANHRDDRLLAPTLDAIGAVGPLPAQAVVHLDAGYDYQPCRQVLADRGVVGQIATRGRPAPIQADPWWVIECTHARGNQHGKLRWCTERRRVVVEFWLALASAVMVCGRLVRRAWTHYHWQGRARRRP
jgi:transposase